MASLTLWQQSEVVRKKKFPEWYEMNFNVLSDFFQKGETEKIGERDFRIPVENISGGRFGAYDPQMGDMGRGTMPNGIVMIQSFFSLRMNYEFDKLAIKATTNRNVAVENPFLKCISKGFREFMLYWDKVIHQDGTAVIATATSFSNSSGVTVYTLDTSFGAQLLRRGQYVGVYDSTLATLKTMSVLYLTAIDTVNRTATLSGIVPSAANTDKIVFEGVSGTSPAGPRGLKYWISAASSGTTAGINRATEPQIISKSVNAASAPFNVEMVQGMYDYILNDRGEVADGLIGICSPSQRAAAMNNMMAIQNILLQDDAKALDRLPKGGRGKKAFMWGGLPHYPDIHQDRSIVHYIVPQLFGTSELAPTDFFQTDGFTGEKGRFIQLYGGSGGPAAGTWFGLTLDKNLYCIDPGAQGLIYTLPQPAFH